MLQIDARNTARLISEGQQPGSEQHAKTTYYGLLGRIIEADMTSDLTIARGNTFRQIRLHAELLLESRIVSAAVQKAQVLGLTDDIEAAALSRYSTSVRNGKIDPTKIILPNLIRSGVMSGSHEISASLASISYLQKENSVSISSGSLKRSVRVPLRHALIHALDQEAVFDHLSHYPGNNEDWMFRPDSVRYDDNSGLHFTGALALSDSKYDTMWQYFGEEPYATVGPQIGCPVTFHSRFIPNIYNSMADAAVRSGLIFVSTEN